MDDHHRPLSKEVLLARLRALPAGTLVDIVHRAEAARAARLSSRLRDRFAELETILPAHQSSMRETEALLNRLRAGTPNLGRKAS